MADDLGDPTDTTFRVGGALHKISALANTWEARALTAERARRANRLERVGWLLVGAACTAIGYSFLRW